MAKFKSLSLDHYSETLIEHPPAETLVVGEVIGNCVPTNQTQARIRWQTSDSQLYERTLSVVKGLSVAAGDLVLLQRPANWPEWVVTQVVESNGPNLSTVPELVVDGERKQIEGLKEIVLRCGKASITLSNNGRITIRGAYVETRASGTNRIKGGAVLIN